jgi:hypothetical protein
MSCDKRTTQRYYLRSGLSCRIFLAAVAKVGAARHRNDVRAH